MESTVLIGCPTCGRRYRYDAGRFGYSGVRIRCRTCESVMRVDVPPALQLPEGQILQQPQDETPPSAASPGSALDIAWEFPAPAPQTEETAEFAAPAPTPEPVQDEVAPEPVQDPAPDATEVPVLPQALVADRDASLRSLLAAALREEGYQVMEVEDGPGVRRALAGQLPQVVVLNVFLPEILGVTLCSEIKRHPRLNHIMVILVGSLYRRDRFMRHPDDLYGADGFIDGSADPEDVRQTLLALCRERSDAAPSTQPDAIGDHEEMARLARIVVGDIILYNPDCAQQELAAGNFLHAFASEIKEGQSLVEDRFGHIPGHVDLYFEIVKDTIARHCEAAGIGTGLRA